MVRRYPEVGKNSVAGFAAVVAKEVSQISEVAVDHCEARVVADCACHSVAVLVESVEMSLGSELRQDCTGVASATVCDVDVSAPGAYGKAFECGVKEDGCVVEFFAHDSLCACAQFLERKITNLTAEIYNCKLCFLSLFPKKLSTGFGLVLLSDISEYPPGDYGGCYGCYCRGMCGDASQAGPPQTGAAFHKQIEQCDGYCEEDKGIVFPCLGDIAVEHGMECALRAAARAVVAADGAQDAARSVAGGVGRIEVTVEKNKRCHSTCYCKCGGSGFKMFFQLPVH